MKKLKKMTKMKKRRKKREYKSSITTHLTNKKYRKTYQLLKYIPTNRFGNFYENYDVETPKVTERDITKTQDFT